VGPTQHSLDGFEVSLRERLADASARPWAALVTHKAVGLGLKAELLTEADKFVEVACSPPTKAKILPHDDQLHTQPHQNVGDKLDGGLVREGPVKTLNNHSRKDATNELDLPLKACEHRRHRTAQH
jgi:hypothetical protein